MICSKQPARTSVVFRTGKFYYLTFLLFALAFAPTSSAQSESASLSGTIVDRSGGLIPDAEVTVVNVDTNVTFEAKTNDAGVYSFPFLKPGHYRILVAKQGFKQIDLREVTLNVQDSVNRNFTLEIGGTSETIVVNASEVNINTTDATVSMVVDRKYVENMPLNGRSFQDLILLMSGVTTTNPQSSTQSESGDFSVNGQRTQSNNYTVDGVSANTYIDPLSAARPGGPSGSLPASTALGTTQSLVSVDALEEFRVQTSTYSAENGRSPGGQFSFVTRSGTNEWHGTAFDYLRNNFFDANDWFNNYFQEPEPPLRQNDFGGTLGGPIDVPGLYNGKDKTFFFFSYEGLRLIQPQAASISYVPDDNLRSSTPAPLQQVLNAFPLPNGQDLGNGLAEFIGTWSNPSDIDSTSLRLDHSVNERLRLFFRFSDTSSSLGSQFASLSEPKAFTTRIYTLGATSSISTGVSNEFRLNYSTNEGEFSATPIDFAGAKAVDLLALQGLKSGSKPSPDVQVTFFFGAQFPSISQFGYAGEQKQWNIVDSLAVSHGRHQFKFGFDVRRLDPSVFQTSPVVSYYYFSANSVQANSVDFGRAQTFAAAHPVYTNFSAFGQDEWKVMSRLSLSIGLRWVINPAPGAPKDNLPYTVQGNSLATLTLAPQGTPLWDTTWFNFAPRLGAAYVVRNTPDWNTVIRGGGGVFFDTAQQLGSLGYSGPGFSAQSFFGELFGSPASFTLPSTQVNPPIINPPVAPYTGSPVYVFPTHLQLPFALQWSFSIEQSLGKSQVLTASYVGANGRRLLEENEVSASSFNPNFGTIFFIRNGRPSDYNALQFQYQRRLTHGLQALASYTWAHAIDYGSLNSSLPYVRGNSDFDVRHNFSAALSYEFPDEFRNGLGRIILNHWGLDSRIAARTAFPVTLQGSPIIDPATGQTINGGLNLVPGQPVYIYGTSCAALYDNGLGCPGGRAINPEAFALPAGCTAFSCPPGTAAGDAPRNFVRGFGAWQMDLAVRREFPIYERLKLQFRAEAFNVFNHPNFGTINPTYCSPSTGPGCTFGQATATLANSLGGLSSLYQMGGPRSLQFALKLMF